MSVKVFYDILNQRSTPAIYTDTIANRPAFGFQGRLFISTDSGQIFEDTGSTWTLVADAGVGGGTLSSVCLNGNTTATGISITAGGLSSNSITNTSNTAGSVLFAGTGGLESQNNTKLFWDNTNFRLGINTATPGAPLDIHGTGTQLQINGTGSSNSYLNFQQAGANKWRVGLTYSTGANYFDIFDNNSSVSRLSILNSGFIGAGTITPKEKLEVAGAVFSTGTNSNLGNFSGVVMDVYNPGTLQTGRIAAYDPAGSNLQFCTNSVGTGSGASLFINSVGKVSVGQDNSGSINYGSFKVGVDASNIAISWNDLASGWGYLGTGTGYAYVGTGGQLAFLRNFPPYSGGSIEMARFDLDGNFGIGTRIPSTKLQVEDGFISTYHNINADGAGYGFQFLTNGGGSKNTIASIDISQVGTSRSGNIIFNTSNSGAPTERMRILSNGPVVINGTTSGYYTNSARGVLQVNGSSQALIALSINNSTANGAYLYHDGTTCYLNNQLNGSSTYVVSYSNGVYLASGGIAWIAASDERLKTNLKPIENALSKVLKLRSVTGRYKTDDIDKSRSFLIAQDVLSVLPEAVNLDEKSGMLGVAYTDLIPLLVAAIKEQQSQIEELKFKINSLQF